MFYPALSRLRLRRPVLEALEARILLDASPLVLSTASGTLQGSVFEDRNADGVRQSSEPGFANRVVYLDTNGNGRFDSTERSASTNANGIYQFTGLTPGSYLVGQIVPSGWQATTAISTASAPSDAHELIRLDRLQADARFRGLDGAGTTIVVIDTGISNHADFGPDANRDGVPDAIRYQYDFINNDPIADDDEGHGTYIAGVIASRNPEHPGIAPKAGIIALKVLDRAGNGSFAAIERALKWVIANATRYNITAVNMSFGDDGNYADPIGLHGVADELALLAARGVPLIAASGNDHGTHNPLAGVMYPGADPSVLAVGAVWDSNRSGPWDWDTSRDVTTAPDRILSFTQRSAKFPMVFAPGSLIVGPSLGGGQSSESGTSSAAAVASGVVALAQQLALQKLGRKLTGKELSDLLRRTGKPIFDGDDENDNVTNTYAAYRRIDAFALAEAIIGQGSVSQSDKPGTLLVNVPAGRTLTAADLGTRAVAPMGNQAPELTGNGQTLTVSEDATTGAGVTVGSMLGTTFQDRNTGTKKGIAIVGAENTKGRWQFSLDGGRSWSDVTSVAPSWSLLLRETDRVRFLPKLNSHGMSKLSYVAWDQTTNFAGQRVNLTRAGSTGGKTAFGTVTVGAFASVTPVNDAPVLISSGRMSWVPKNATNPPGNRVFDVLVGTWRDVDLDTKAGMAIFASGGRGRWQYSSDGRTWSNLGTVTVNAARLLNEAMRLRFVPEPGFVGEAWLRYRVWDKTQGSAGGLINFASTGIGGKTAFSTTEGYLRARVG